jgi:hypothetical protein
MSHPTLKQLCAAATPGPYHVDLNEFGDLVIHGPETEIPIATAEGDNASANAQLIARLDPQTVLAVYEALEAALYLHDQHQIHVEEPAFEGEYHKIANALSLLNGNPPTP